MKKLHSYRSPEFSLSFEEFYGFCRFLVKNCQANYITVHIDDKQPTTRTGGEIYEGVRAIASVLTSDNGLVLQVNMSESEFYTFDIKTIRSITLGRIKYLNSFNNWVAGLAIKFEFSNTEIHPEIKKLMPEKV